MTRPRFLLVFAEGRQALSGLTEHIPERTGLGLALARPSFVLFANEACGCLPLGDQAVVMGTLFQRHAPARPLASLDDGEGEAIAATGGNRLLTHYWGGYVAAISSAGRVRVLRDPSAALPCYFVRNGEITAFAADIDCLVDSGLAAIEIDWRRLARHFHSAGVPSAATALRGISELLPGHEVTVFGDGAPSPCWSPWDHVHGRHDAADAAEVLEQAVRRCVTGWTAQYRRLLVSVSGGLDSSVVAASLAGGGREVIGLTVYGDDPAGDERVYARTLCAHLGFELVERADRLEDVDIAEPLAAHLPRPIGRTQSLTFERAHVETARAVAADAFVSGNGGDSVFGYSQSAAAVADRYLHDGMSGGVLATLRDVCRQTGAGPVEVARSAIRIARGPRSYRCRPNKLFLHPDRIAELAGIGLDHPWLEAPAGALPGKAAHIASILRVQQCLEPGRSRCLPVLNPLMSQPVLEACLAIPSWMWRSGGRDRAVARDAFSGSLPEVILRRRVKGGPDGFAARILDTHRAPIRDRLARGRLAREGIIDVPAIMKALADERPALSDERVRILELLSAEAWLDAWASRAVTAAGERHSVGRSRLPERSRPRP